MYADARYRASGMIETRYLGTTPAAFNDSVGAYRVSLRMLQNGVAIIFHAAGGAGDGLFKAADEAGKAAIGVDSDQGLIYQSSPNDRIRERARHILTSMVKRIDVAVVLKGKEFLDSGNRVAGGYRAIGLKENGLDFADNRYNTAQLAEVREKVLQIKADVLGGRVEVPDEYTDMTSWARSLE
jgi:basic membrane protein A